MEPFLGGAGVQPEGCVAPPPPRLPSLQCVNVLRRPIPVPLGVHNGVSVLASALFLPQAQIDRDRLDFGTPIERSEEEWTKEWHQELTLVQVLAVSAGSVRSAVCILKGAGRSVQSAVWVTVPEPTPTTNN